jgi:hypothetical protein
MKQMEHWHRRHAMAIAGQLPEHSTDALLVIEAMRQIVETFLTPAEATSADTLAANVVAFRGGQPVG